MKHDSNLCGCVRRDAADVLSGAVADEGVYHPLPRPGLGHRPGQGHGRDHPRRRSAHGSQVLPLPGALRPRPLPRQQSQA